MLVSSAHCLGPGTLSSSLCTSLGSFPSTHRVPGGGGGEGGHRADKDPNWLPAGSFRSPGTKTVSDLRSLGSSRSKGSSSWAGFLGIPLSCHLLGWWHVLASVLESPRVSPSRPACLLPSSRGCRWGSGQVPRLLLGIVCPRDLPCLTASHVFKITVPISC